jgi:hypothetical protein
VVETDRVSLTNEDAAFVVGRGGMCKFKIARAANARLDFNERESVVEIRGSPLARRRAAKYVRLVKAQRVGPVHLDPVADDDGDLTIVIIPHDCIGYVTGKKGATMRSMEEEWGTLMFFIDEAKKVQSSSSDDDGSKAEPPLDAQTGHDPEQDKKEEENPDGKEEEDQRKKRVGQGKLAVFGDQRGRRGTELKVMSAVEQKVPGYFTSSVELHISEDEWGTDTVPIQEDLSYALGKGGVTRKKLARASNCIMEYVGSIAFMSGTLAERKRARDYLSWLMQQRRGSVRVEDVEKRDDVTVLQVPSQCVAFITGTGGRSLRAVEEQTGTFCFIDGDRRGENERLLVFGGTEDARLRAKKMVEDMVDVKLGRGRAPVRASAPALAPAPPSGGSSLSKRRSRSRSRSRSPRRSSRKSYSRDHSRSRSRSRSESRSRKHSKSRSKRHSRGRSRSSSPSSRSSSRSRSRSRTPKRKVAKKGDVEMAAAGREEMAVDRHSKSHSWSSWK